MAVDSLGSSHDQERVRRQIYMHSQWLSQSNLMMPGVYRAHIAKNGIARVSPVALRVHEPLTLLQSSVLCKYGWK